MQHTFTREHVIPASPDAVFDFLTDQGHINEWSPEVVESEVLGDAIEVGTRLRQVRQQGKRRVTSLVDVVAHEPGRRHAVRTRVLGNQATFEFTLTPDAGGTRVAMSGEIRGRWLAALVTRGIGRAIERADDRRLEQLEDAMARAGRLDRPA